MQFTFEVAVYHKAMKLIVLENFHYTVAGDLGNISIANQLIELHCTVIKNQLRQQTYTM